MCVGIAGRILGLDATTAEIDVDGRALRVSLIAVDEPVDVGDWLLVHSGIALRRLSELDVHLLQLARGEPR